MLAAETKIDFGMTVRTPMIEITTIGAGGGSIAWRRPRGPAAGRPRESAGSDPGPACYGKGASSARPSPTPIVVLGRINGSASRSAASWPQLDVEAAKAAIDRACWPQPLELDTSWRRRRRSCGWPTARMAGAIAPGVDRARPRPQALRPDAVRRRRGIACRCPDEGDRPRLDPGAALSRASPRRSAASSPTCATISFAR